MLYYLITNQSQVLYHAKPASCGWIVNTSNKLSTWTMYVVQVFNMYVINFLKLIYTVPVLSLKKIEIPNTKNSKGVERVLTWLLHEYVTSTILKTSLHEL